jgi:hypothetical protein
VLLGAVGAAGVLLVRVALPDAGGNPPAGARAPRQPQAAAPGSLPPLERVRLEALASPRPDPGPPVRNPFVFGSRRAAGPPPSAGPSDPGRLTASFPPPPSMAAGPPPPAPIPLKFIGVVERGPALRVAVLSDGRHVLYGQEGEVLDGRYRIERIGPDSIDLAYTDGRGRQTIRLSGS